MFRERLCMPLSHTWREIMGEVRVFEVTSVWNPLSTRTVSASFSVCSCHGSSRRGKTCCGRISAEQSSARKGRWRRCWQGWRGVRDRSLLAAGLQGRREGAVTGTYREPPGQGCLTGATASPGGRQASQVTWPRRKQETSDGWMD